MLTRKPRFMMLGEYLKLVSLQPAVRASDYLILIPSAQFIGIVFGLSIGGAIFINQALKALRVILPTAPESDLRRVISGTFGILLFPCEAGRNIFERKIYGCELC